MNRQGTNNIVQDSLQQQQLFKLSLIKKKSTCSTVNNMKKARMGQEQLGGIFCLYFIME